MSKWIIDLPEGCEGNCRDCFVLCPGFPDIKKEAKPATEVTDMMKFCVVNSDGSGTYLRGKPAKVYAVEVG